MGLGIDSSVVIIRNPYIFPQSTDPETEIRRLAEFNTLVILLQSGKTRYPFAEDQLPSNVHIIRYSYFEGEEDILEAAKDQIQDLLAEVGAEVKYDVMPVLFNGAYLRMPEQVKFHVVQSPEQYNTSNLTKAAFTEEEMDGAEWLL